MANQNVKKREKEVKGEVEERVSKEAHAYTPGLKVKSAMTVRKTRRLPLLGEVLVKMGDVVDFDTVVVVTETPGEPFIIEATNLMALQPHELPKYLVKKVDDRVRKGEPVAQWKALFGLINRVALSPIDGVVENFSDLTGRVTVREPPTLIEIKAYVPGKIVEVIPREAVVIETNAAFIQGIFGLGGERHGQLLVLTETLDETLMADMITSEHKGKIIVGGSYITLEALMKAVEIGVGGVVVAGINADDLHKFLGYRMGVAITGEEDLETTLIITEGFGKMKMSKKTFELLKGFRGKEAAINGATQIRAGVLRPEVIIPHKELQEETTADELGVGLKPGTTVRIIRTPNFGRLGVVISLPVELQELGTESEARVLQVEIETGEQVIVPRANVEIIEE
jgi:hypothetical protein